MNVAPFRIEDIALDDQKTYDLISRGDIVGVFQLDSYGGRKIALQVRPRSIEDIGLAIALNRPGPLESGTIETLIKCRRGQQEATYLHPLLAPILAETHGTLVYQEQVMRVASEIAGYSMADADIMRQAIGKKHPQQMQAEHKRFCRGLVNSGFTDGQAEALWEQVEVHAGYSFNLCLSGNTIINQLSSPSKHWSTIAELYGVWHAPRGTSAVGDKYRAKDCPSQRKGLFIWGGVDGKCKPVRVRDVVYQGEQSTTRITLIDGKFIESTSNHRHMTFDGWVEAGSLKVGDMLATLGVRNKDYVTGRNVPTALKREIRERHVCAFCGDREVDASKFEVAHLNQNPKDNRRENLALLCNPCHKQYDWDAGTRKPVYSRGREIYWKPIVAINNAGIQPVYDLVIDSNDHSFVANGIVTHNSHSIAYAMTSYHCAYLKAHYPLQFFTALLNARIGRPDKLAETKRDVREHHIKMLPPDINLSTDVFTVGGDGILYGLTALPDFGKSAYASLIAGRRDAPFTSLDDVLNRCNMSKLNEKALRALIKSGAMPGDPGLLMRSLKPAMAAWRKHKIDTAKLKSGWVPRQRRKKEATT